MKRDDLFIRQTENAGATVFRFVRGERFVAGAKVGKFRCANDDAQAGRGVEPCADLVDEIARVARRGAGVIFARCAKAGRFDVDEAARAVDCIGERPLRVAASEARRHQLAMQFVEEPLARVFAEARVVLQAVERVDDLRAGWRARGELRDDEIHERVEIRRHVLGMRFEHRAQDAQFGRFADRRNRLQNRARERAARGIGGEPIGSAAGCAGSFQLSPARSTMRVMMLVVRRNAARGCRRRDVRFAWRLRRAGSRVRRVLRARRGADRRSGLRVEPSAREHRTPSFHRRVRPRVIRAAPSLAGARHRAACLRPRARARRRARCPQRIERLSAEAEHAGIAHAAACRGGETIRPRRGRGGRRRRTGDGCRDVAVNARFAGALHDDDIDAERRPIRDDGAR